MPAPEVLAWGSVLSTVLVAVRGLIVLWRSPREPAQATVLAQLEDVRSRLLALSAHVHAMYQANALGLPLPDLPPELTR